MDQTATRRRSGRGSTHGMAALKSKVNLKGLSALDKRTQAARGLLAWRDALVTALGGSETISPQEMALVEQACRTKLYIDSADHFILEQSTIVNRRKKSLIPIVRERVQLADALTRYLTALGLQRRAKDVTTLSDALAQLALEDKQDAEKNGNGGTSEPDR